ncbi:MAG: tyrosine-type recombinase/integrase [Hungatella sp.]
MRNQSIKTQIINHVLVAMSRYAAQGVLKILEEIIMDEFTKVNMEEITTLPAELKNDIDVQNEYVIKLFLYKKKNLKKGTKEAYLGAIKRLLLAADKALNTMDEMDIHHYLDQYEKRNISSGGQKNQASTVNNERRFLSAFFTWMRKEKLIRDNPVESAEVRKISRKPIDYFSQEEMEKLRDGCKTLRERAVIEFLRSTGARVGEVLEIDRNSIDWITGDILICGEKGDRYRTIYLDKAARHHLKKYFNSRTDRSSGIFVSSKKPYKSLSSCGIRLILKQIAERTEVTCRVYPHKMRKTLGMDLKNKGVDIGTIQEILGHADPAVTAAYYAQSTPNTLRYVRERTAA